MTDFILTGLFFFGATCVFTCLSYCILYPIFNSIKKKEKMGVTREGLIEEYKALLELQTEAVDVVVDVGHALEEVEAHLNAVGVTIIAV